jgi:type I restriction enzyme M protein
MVESITIPIPVDTDGEYDLVKQQEVALMYATVEQFKSKLTTDLERLESLVVEAGS